MLNIGFNKYFLFCQVGRIFSKKSIIKIILSTIVLLVQHMLKVIIAFYDDVTSLQSDVTKCFPSCVCYKSPLTSTQKKITHLPVLDSTGSVSTENKCSVREPRSEYGDTEIKRVTLSSAISTFVQSTIARTAEHNHTHFVEELQSIWTNNSDIKKYNFNIQLLNFKPQL